MDAYLDLAARVLRSKRRPLSARTILAAGYDADLVPASLYGKTQHKTLQARLSEDIVERRDRSMFFRTQPGRFFLRDFLTDSSIPVEFRDEFPARPRMRDLTRGPALAINARQAEQLGQYGKRISPKKVLGLLRSKHYHYEHPKRSSPKSVFVRAFVCVHRDFDILTYRVGRYRDDRDAFMARRSIGFSSLVDLEQQSLFNMSDLGIVDSGVRAITIDLGLPSSNSGQKDDHVAELKYFLVSSEPSGSIDLLAVIHFSCPSWFEPTKRRLALNDLRWMDGRNKLNNVADFDPWSRQIIESETGEFAYRERA